jgi:hypothetical protein
MPTHNQSGHLGFAGGPNAFRDLNDQNRRFWVKQSQLRNERIANEAILEITTNDMRSETSRSVPIKAQKSLEQALADAENSKKCFQSQFSRKGGKARKGDALRDLIDEIVLHEPEIRAHQLLRALKGERGLGRVSIDGGSDYLSNDRRDIHFNDYKGTPKAAPVSGLKDRLSRAKAKNKIARTG